ncbi:MAG: hypothetical protein Q9175_003095 [Cornicularia normoerica]
MPQPAQAPHFLPQPTITGKIIPSLVVTVLELHFEFVAEIVSNSIGGDVIVVVMGTLVGIVEPRRLTPTIPRRKGAEEAREEVNVALITGIWEVVDETDEDKVCPGEATVESLGLEDTESGDGTDVDEDGCEVTLLESVKLFADEVKNNWG